MGLLEIFQRLVRKLRGMTIFDSYYTLTHDFDDLMNNTLGPRAHSVALC